MATIEGGNKMNGALSEIARKLGKRATLQVGFFPDATYPDGTLVAAVAAYNNFGTDKIPPRPFFSNMVAEKSGDWPRAIAKNLKANNYDVELTLGLVGQGIKDQLQQSIKDTNSPPLAKSTIQRKGFEKPLIDTGQMFDNVKSIVKT